MPTVPALSNVAFSSCSEREELLHFVQWCLTYRSTWGILVQFLTLSKNTFHTASEELLSLVELTGEVLVDSSSQAMASSTVARIMSFSCYPRFCCITTALGSPPLEKRGGLYHSVYSSLVPQIRGLPKFSLHTTKPVRNTGARPLQLGFGFSFLDLLSLLS